MRTPVPLAKQYDYIVCGAGSSGSVIARRLAEDGVTRVLLVESGGSDEAAAWPAFGTPDLQPFEIAVPDHKLTYTQPNHAKLHVNEDRDKGNTDTPLKLVILHSLNRFRLCIDVVDKMPGAQEEAEPFCNWMHRHIQFNLEQMYSENISCSESGAWTWPHAEVLA